MGSVFTRRWGELTASLENLPPFWAVYGLILVETLGEGVLAIPIAVAKIGPLAGVGVLIVIGLVNIVTIAAIAEASARNGSIRYGEVYLGRMVHDYLGGAGTVVLALSVAVIQLLALVSYFVGFSATMAEATHIPSAAWAASIFLVCFYFLRKGAFASTIAVVLLTGGLNVGIILLLSLLTLPHIHVENILEASVPLAGLKSFEPSLFQLVFGVIFSAYLGHLGVANSAQIALRRDASARSLIWGSVAAQGSLMVIYCLWVLVVNGAISPSVLADEAGTALVPLASVIGPTSYLLGSIVMVLGIGVASIVTALGLFYLVREWLPKSVEAAFDSQKALRIRPPGLGTIQGAVLGHRGRFMLSASPVLAVFVYVEWLLLTGQHSFTTPLSFLGVLAAPLIAGVFPVLLLLASRAKGDRPTLCYLAWLGNPFVIAVIYAVFVANLCMHGFVIWQHPVERLAALVAGVVVLALPVVLTRQGVFASRAVVELRQESLPGTAGAFAILCNGRAFAARVRFEYPEHGTFLQSSGGVISDFSLLRRVEILLSGHAIKEIKMWVHRPTGDDDTNGIPVLLTVSSEAKSRQFDLRRGQIVVPVGRGPVNLEVEFQNNDFRTRSGDFEKLRRRAVDTTASTKESGLFSESASPPK